MEITTGIVCIAIGVLFGLTLADAYHGKKDKIPPDPIQQLKSILHFGSTCFIEFNPYETEQPWSIQKYSDGNWCFTVSDETSARAIMNRLDSL